MNANIVQTPLKSHSITLHEEPKLKKGLFKDQSSHRFTGPSFALQSKAIISVDANSRHKMANHSNLKTHNGAIPQPKNPNM